MADQWNRWVAVAKSDTANQAEGLFDAIYAGGAGNVVVVQEDGTASTVAVIAGQTVYIRGKRINNTSTTATGLFALYR